MDTKVLRQKVLDLAIRGKLVPQDTNDEPASVLLERIRQQKQQMVKDGKLKAKDIKNDTIIFVGEDNLHYEKFTDGSEKCIEDEIPFELPDGWAWSKVGPLCEYITSGSRGWAQYYSDTGSLFLRMGNLSRDSFELRMDNLQRVDLPDNAEGVRTRVTENDLLFSITAEIGMLGLIPADFEEAYINQHVGLIRFLKEAQAKYFPYILMSDFCRNQYYTTQSGMKNSFRLDNIQNILTPVPPLAEQIRIAEKLSCIWAQIQQIDSESATARDIIILAKAKILDLAIRGQLVPQDPVDEPASVLLERIRAEKEELIRQGKIKRDKKESVIFRGEDNSYYQKVEADGSVVIQRVDVPPTWAVCCLQEISYPVSTVGMQIKSEEIQKDGVFPVISQGQSFIDGYYSDESKVIYDSPIILFGDHTRNVKYIDFPFVVGADGTKLHKVIRANERYVYYWMCHASQCIADRGYARHYSLLQKECFTLPPSAEQIRIVNCIDQLFAQLDSIADALL